MSRTATGLVTNLTSRNGASLSSSNIPANPMSGAGMNSYSVSGYPLSPISNQSNNPLNQPPAVNPRSHSLAAPRNSQSLSISSQKSSQQNTRKTSASSGFATPSGGHSAARGTARSKCLLPRLRQKLVSLGHFEKIDFLPENVPN